MFGIRSDSKYQVFWQHKKHRLTHCRIDKQQNVQKRGQLQSPMCFSLFLAGILSGPAGSFTSLAIEKLLG